jgi:hypothetical protein
MASYVAGASKIYGLEQSSDWEKDAIGQDCPTDGLNQCNLWRARFKLIQ